MRYLGGKSRLASKIAPILEAHRAPGQTYLEPFVGGGSVLCAMSGPRRAYDLNEALIAMWIALRDGWTPPSELSEDEWRFLKALQDPRDPLTAFAGFGCSFAAVWFCSYAKYSKGYDHVGASARALKKQQSLIQDVDFGVSDYRDLDPTGCVVYCDPPYANTDSKGYRGVPGQFDSDIFWQTMLDWAYRATVFVSEFDAPLDTRIEEVWSIGRAMTGFAGEDGKRQRKIDRLYRVQRKIDRLYRVHGG